MPRVRIGPALPDRDTLDVEIACLRGLDIAALRRRWHTMFGGDRRSTYLLICCFGSWLTGCRPTGWVTSMMRAGVCSMVQAPLRRLGRMQRI